MSTPSRPSSRSRNAVVAAAFTYAQFGLAALSGFVLIPIILRAVGARPYGVWLATGEIVAYAGMLDLGVVGMLPWLVAQADGRRDVVLLRALLSRAMAVATLAGATVLILLSMAMTFIPAMLRLPKSDFDTIAGPLVLVVAAMAITYPLKVFNAVLVGLQDVRFAGLLSVSQTIVSVGLTVWLVESGRGLYAVAAGAALPPVFVGLASLVRLHFTQRELLRGWAWPDTKGIRWMVLDGAGAWAGGLGWMMVAGTAGMVITFLGRPEAVVVYACTAKLSQLLFHLSRVLPDSAMVGLAQVSGEGRMHRVQKAAGTILRVHLILAGAAALAALSFGPLFVSAWVGEAFFGGLGLNVGLVGTLLFMSLTHGLVSCAAVLGHRRAIGIATLACGLLTVPLAVMLGGAFGLTGVAIAPILSGAVTTLPAGIRLLGRAAGLSVRSLVLELWLPWAWRCVPALVVVVAAARFSERLSSQYVASVVVGIAALVVYVLLMRSLCPELLVNAQLRRWAPSLGMTTQVDPERAAEMKP